MNNNQIKFKKKNLIKVKIKYLIILTIHHQLVIIHLDGMFMFIKVMMNQINNKRNKIR